MIPNPSIMPKVPCELLQDLSRQLVSRARAHALRVKSGAGIFQHMRYMRRRGIENASKEPTAVNPAMDQNTMRKASEISACSKTC
jgi:hypothetical protein